ncbi:Bax inhibitor-1/YccA family protein [Fusobacterium sp.]|uniref:Bax inhibitor-1/YccA family protein n=1 Tax=Fusobacterium sp. TaxID=68766 RepID=UPI0026116878|nr:Bax inhibitor-1/YccA family protein [Fusobacterium sp.]
MYDEQRYVDITASNKLLRTSFTYMILGLLVTFLIPAYIIFSANGLLVASYIWKFYTPIIILEFVTVILFSARINKISSLTAKLMFFFYSFLNGLVFSLIGIAFVGNLEIILYTLLTTIIMFTVIAVYGYTTKEDLSNYGGYLKTGLISLIIISLINMFLKAPSFYWIVTILGVVIFSALIAFDVNRIKSMAYEIADGDNEVIEKLGIVGALNLYLDFVNLFLYILRIFSKKK